MLLLEPCLQVLLGELYSHTGAMEVHPGGCKALTGVLEFRSGAFDVLTGKRCEHTCWLNMTAGWRSTHPLPHLWGLWALEAPVVALVHKTTYAPMIYVPVRKDF